MKPKRRATEKQRAALATEKYDLAREEILDTISWALTSLTADQGDELRADIIETLELQRAEDSLAAPVAE